MIGKIHYGIILLSLITTSGYGVELSPGSVDSSRSMFEARIRGKALEYELQKAKSHLPVASELLQMQEKLRHKQSTSEIEYQQVRRDYRVTKEKVALLEGHVAEFKAIAAYEEALSQGVKTKQDVLQVVRLHKDLWDARLDNSHKRMPLASAVSDYEAINVRMARELYAKKSLSRTEYINAEDDWRRSQIEVADVESNIQETKKAVDYADEVLKEAVKQAKAVKNSSEIASQ